MQLLCPHCGLRGHDEFAYLGVAKPQRPDPSGPDAESAFSEYVYLRANAAGAHTELWYHAHGCQMWLIVERDTRTHQIGAVVEARHAARSAAGE